MNPIALRRGWGEKDAAHRRWLRNKTLQRRLAELRQAGRGRLAASRFYNEDGAVADETGFGMPDPQTKGGAMSARHGPPSPGGLQARDFFLRRPARGSREELGTTGRQHPPCTAR